MNWNMYTDKVIEHFMSPRNTGTMVEADGEEHFGEPECGDSYWSKCPKECNYGLLLQIR